MLIAAFYVYLFHDRKGYTVIDLTKFGRATGIVGFLAGKIIGWEAQYSQTIFFEFLVQGF